MDTETLSFHILDALVTAPSSVAGIYADLVYLLGFDRQQVVEPLHHALETLESRGWVAARLSQPNTEMLRPASGDEKEQCWRRYAVWLPAITRNDLAVDDIGLWYGLTDAGRTAWQTFGVGAPADTWELDEDAEQRKVSVVAESREIAELRLSEWLLRRPGITITAKHVSPIAMCKLRNGRMLYSGVRIMGDYAVQSN